MSELDLTWQDFLRPEEKQRLEEIEVSTKAAFAEKRRIFQRCRARLKRHEAQA